MKAAVLTESGVQLRDVPTPKPAPNQVLVRVRACGLNRADLIMASGHMHGSVGGPGTVMGMEFAGEVAEVGAEVKTVRPGDRVMCSGNGAYAEFAVTDWGRVAPIPANNMSFEQAATLPVALQTMHDAVVTNGRLKAGEAVMIQGASSGVGLMGLQIAKLKGARWYSARPPTQRGGSGSRSSAPISPLTRPSPSWADKVLAATDRKGVDLIVDQVSASVANENMRATAVLGRIVNVGRLGGFKGEFDFDLHAMKRIDYIGVTFRTRSLDEVREINRRMRADLWPHIEAGELALPIDKVFPLGRGRSRAGAHARQRALRQDRADGLMCRFPAMASLWLQSANTTLSHTSPT